jgi:hypothetical protein
MLISPHAKVIATLLAIQIVIEGALLAVFKENTHQAGPASNDRRHLLDNRTPTPLSIVEVDDPVPESEVKTLLLIHDRSQPHTFFLF